MTMPAAQRRFSPQEYLRLDEAAIERHEFHAGEILAMSGGTYEHSRVNANISREIGVRIKGSRFFVLDSNMRVCVSAEERYVYPDMLVVCGEPHFDPLDANRTSILNPTIVVEVLSDSTEGYNRGDKFTAYRELTSLREYVLVSQKIPMIETFFRQEDGTWLFCVFRGPNDVADVYGGVTFGM